MTRPPGDPLTTGSNPRRRAGALRSNGPEHAEKMQHY